MGTLGTLENSLPAITETATRGQEGNTKQFFNSNSQRPSSLCTPEVLSNFQSHYIYHMPCQATTLRNMLFPWPEYPLPAYCAQPSRVSSHSTPWHHFSLLTDRSQPFDVVHTNLDNSLTHWNFSSTYLCPLQDKAYVFLIRLCPDPRTVPGIQYRVTGWMYTL